MKSLSSAFVVGIVISVGIVVGAMTGTTAQEIASIDTPIQKTVSTFSIDGFSFSRMPWWRVSVVYRDNLDNTFTDTQTDVEARDMIIQLNKADLSTRSLERRLMEHLIKEGKIPAATITGVPQ